MMPILGGHLDSAPLDPSPRVDPKQQGSKAARQQGSKAATMTSDRVTSEGKTFEGKVVLVTGASGGIGQAIARRFATRGARLVLQANSHPEKAEGLASQLMGDGHFVVVADLRDSEAVAAMVDTAAARCGRIDVLVNNAGIFTLHPPGMVDYATWLEQWRCTLETNLIGAANASFCAARVMRRHGGGRIINISSRGAFRGEPEAPAYGASKAGLNALSQSLALALADDGIFVFAVAPGFVETAMARPHMSGERAELIKRQSPLKRVARPEDVAYWVVCCASEDACFATGAIIDVNGASYLRS